MGGRLTMNVLWKLEIWRHYGEAFLEEAKPTTEKIELRMKIKLSIARN